jgi:beta-glucosidase
MGEDPYLSGQLAAYFINGMQDQGVMACAKHYAANNQEFNRHHCSSDMDERTLHEIYLPAFKTAVQQGKAATVMTSYNPINGVHASENSYLINDVLKGAWNFKGFVISDWASTYNGIPCATAGLDLEMPFAKVMNKEILIPAIKNGTISEEVINNKIRRILTTYKDFGLFENPDLRKGFIMDTVFTKQTALDAARDGMVLLKNENKILPLNKNKLTSIAIIGPNALNVATGGGGSSWVNSKETITLVDAVKNISGNNVKVAAEQAVFTGVPFPNNLFEGFDFYVYKDGKRVTGANAEFFNNKKLEGNVIYSCFYEKVDLHNGTLWNPVEVPESDFSTRFTCFYTPTESGYYCIGACGDDGYRIFINGVKEVDAWRDQGPTNTKCDMFMNGGQEYKIVLEYYQAGGNADITLGAKKVVLDTKPEEYQSKAFEIAKNADVVILAVGFSSSTESESYDRTFEMPYKQGEFISQIAKINPNVIVILNSGSNVDMNGWLDNAKALLMAWYPGSYGNQAAAEILFGLTNPSGKLPASFEYKLEDNPCFNSYFDKDEDLKVFYSEGIFMGYRYWDKAASKPRFPFGFGLSYTNFTISDIATDKKEYSKTDKVKVTITVKNIGNMDGAEVVQLYVSDKKSSLPRPLKELKAFEKVKLKKGEKKTLIIELNQDAFSYYNPAVHNWEIESGEFEICLGNSSENITQRTTIVIK